MWSACLSAQEIHWKGRELQAGAHKVIEGEISIRTQNDTIVANRAILINQPKRAVLQGNVTLKKDGSTVTGDSGVYYPNTRQARVAGRAVIRTPEGDIFSESFLYSLNDRQLFSEAPVHGMAKGIRFQAERGLIFPGNGNIKLSGRASWENDSIKGMADTIYLDKASQVLKMSRNARILYKKKKDEISGSYIELDLKESKISKIEGSEIRRQDMRIKAKGIRRKGEDYDLQGNVKLVSTDSLIQAEGDQAQIQKDKMNMQGNTVTRIKDKDGKKITIYSPFLHSAKSGGREEYHFFTHTHLRGDFTGYADSLKMLKAGKESHIFLYRNCHLQNDSLYMEGDTIEIHQDSLSETIFAKRNALMVMNPRSGRLNVISAASISLTKSDSLSEMRAENETESFLWNEEKGNVGLNHTIAPFQKAKIRGRKVSRVTTRGVSKSDFQPLKKANTDYVGSTRKRISLRYLKDSLSGRDDIPPLQHFLRKVR